VHPLLASVHPRFLTPHVSIAFIGAITIFGALLGDALLIPLSELGSLAIAVGWLAACLSFLKGVSWSDSHPPGGATLAIAAMGALVASALVLMKLLPFVPGHLGWPQYLGLGIWMLIGVVLWRAGSRR
jgi:hypothetical protein